MAVSRSRASVRSRFGSSSQLRSARLPMPVWQTSSSENSVGLVSPRRVWVSSRLRRVVIGQVDQLVAARHAQAFHMAERAALRVFGVVEQGGGGGACIDQTLSVPGGEAGGTELFEQLAFAQRAVERPGRAQHGHGALAVRQRAGRRVPARSFQKRV